MTKRTPAASVAVADAPQLASSAVVVGTARLGDGALLSEGAVIRARAGAVEIGTGSAVIENARSCDVRSVSEAMAFRIRFAMIPS